MSHIIIALEAQAFSVKQPTSTFSFFSPPRSDAQFKAARDHLEEELRFTAKMVCRLGSREFWNCLRKPRCFVSDCKCLYFPQRISLYPLLLPLSPCPSWCSATPCRDSCPTPSRACQSMANEPCTRIWSSCLWECRRWLLVQDISFLRAAEPWWVQESQYRFPCMLWFSIFTHCVCVMAKCLVHRKLMHHGRVLH